MSLLGGSGLSAADLAAVVGKDGAFGGGDSWLLLLFIIILLGGNGNGFGNNGVGAEVQQGFDQAAIINGIQGVQNSVTNGQFELMQGFQNCCCENRLGIANLGAQIAADGCATRQVVNDTTRDMIQANYQNSQNQINAMNLGFQGIMDKICQLELDAKNDKIADLQRQLTYQQNVADNAAQTATILSAINGQGVCPCGC